MEKQKRRKNTFWLALTIFSLVGQVAWTVENMYLNVFIYKTFGASASDISNMVAASAVIATLTTVFMGALSDRVGKRKLFICGGYILWGLSIFGFAALRTDLLSTIAGAASAASLGISLTILLDCIMTFFGSTANDAAFNAWLTDSTTEKNRGAAESVNAMMPLISILAVFGGFMFLDLDIPSSWTIIFSVIGILVLLIGIIGAFIIKEPDISRDRSPYLAGILYGFRASTIRKNPRLYITLAAFILLNVSIQIFMPYLIIYYEVSLGMTNYVLILAPAVILAAAVTAVWGRFYDKKGFSVSGALSIAILVLGYAILYLTKSTAPVFIGSLLMMSGYLSSIAVFGAMIRDNTPVGKSGRLQGIRIFSQVLIPGIIGPYIGKTVLANADTLVGNDGTVSFIPNANIFIAAAVAALIVFPVFFILKNKKPTRFAELTTDFENDEKKDGIPFAEYPRPQMRRDSYISLNGEWSFKIKRNGVSVYSGKITVPFCPESRLSGVMRSISDDDVLVYERSTDLRINDEERIILHIGACDTETEVYVNGCKATENRGGYLPFSADITDMCRSGNNLIRIEARDRTDPNYPYGKQTKKRGGMWYTKISGIWQTVWIEHVPNSHIEKIKITPDLLGIDLEISGGEEEKTLSFNGKDYTFTGDHFRLDVEAPILWTPDDPHLYDFSITSGSDKVYSYFALRTVSIGERNGRSFILLNGEPIFCHGLLDQGYFPDGIFLPASERGYKEDVLKMKECGFNMLRKHIKLEPDIFYYYCDKYGMLVFQDMINSGKYSFIVDTALPTVFLKKGVTHRASKKRREEFYRTSLGIIEALYNHPSVVYYTIFNEGWGQFSEKECYDLLKGADPTRIYDTTSGWFKVDSTDVESDHVYFKPVKLKSVKGRPMVLSEFGGYVCKIDGHSFNTDKTYGYRFFDSTDKLEDALISLYEDEIMPETEKGLCATVLTQVSDVEDETNGLLTYDRKVLKVSPDRMSDMAKRLYAKFSENNR